MKSAASFSEAARTLGIVSATGVALLCAVYVLVLLGGLLTLPTPQDPIGDPFFTIMEILILLLAPLMVVLQASILAFAPERSKIFGVVSLVFMGVLATLTCGVHFVILTVSRDTAAMAMTSAPVIFEFKWPSVVYALDILAWDIFFGFSALFAAVIFKGRGLSGWIRRLLIASGVLAFAGLSGIVSGDMQLRNIGIIGYVGVFPVAAALLAALFIRTRADPSARNQYVS